MEFGALTAFRDPAGSTPVWHACHTRARHEKQVIGRLERAGVECYLPLWPRTRAWSDRQRTVLWPLFAGYVFARCAGAAGLSRVLGTRGVVAVVGTAGRPAVIPCGEIEIVRRLCTALVAGARVERVEQAPLPAEGDWVMVTDGPFAGVEGRVLRHAGQRRIVVGVRAIGQGLAVEFSARALAPATAPDGHAAPAVRALG